MHHGTIKILFAAGLIFSPFYALLMRLRALLYRYNIFLKQERVGAPVVSIGNLTMGGTGKTPLVMYLCRFLQGMGRRPAVLSRGYGRRGRGVAVVSDGARVLLGPERAGDEPLLLARSLAGVPVLVGADRRAAARRAITQLQADCLVLDDGFQHLALARDLNLALFGARTLLGNGRVFPGGDLREPLAALGRADAFVITGVDRESRGRVESFRRFLKERFPDIPSFSGEYLPVCLVHSGHEKTVAMDKAKAMPLHGFAGIADPESFRQTLLRERFRLTGFTAFNDHHAYCRRDFNRLVEEALAAKARGLLTTEKDFVKLAPWFDDFPVMALRIELFMEEEFDLFLADRL